MNRPAQLAVLGHPIAHSFSPLLHRTSAQELGVNWDYTRFDLRPEELPGFLAPIRHHWLGLSLTMPLKRTVIPFLSTADARVRRLGVANTVRFRDGALEGANTDVLGFLRLIEDTPPMDAALILGSGATALSALAALDEAGIHHVQAAVRTPAHADPLRAYAAEGGFPLRVFSLAELPKRAPTGTLVISALPPGATDTLTLTPATPGQPLVDAAYGAHDLPFVTRWRAGGGTACDGTALLVEQAIPQDAFFLGLEADTRLPEESRLRAALHAALGR